MLHEPDLCAAHDLICFLVLQKHADDRRFWQQRRNFACNPAMFGKLQQRCIESGTVVVVDGTNLLLYRFTAEDRGIHGEIAALGVPADKQRSERKRGCCLLQIVCRVALRRNFRRERHVEVFLPADNRVVCAAEGDIGAAVRQEHRHGRKLCLRFFVNPVHIAEQAETAKACGLCCLLNQHRNLIRHQNTHIGGRMGSKIGIPCLAERDLLRFKASGREAGKVQIADLCQNQIVHLVERPLGKRQIAPPVEIVENVCHSFLRML